MPFLYGKYENLLQLRAFQICGCLLLGQGMVGREWRGWVLPAGEGDCPGRPGRPWQSLKSAVPLGLQWWPRQLTAKCWVSPMCVRSASLQLKVSHNYISQQTAICNWGVRELGLTASISAAGKADSSTKVCLPQMLEWTGNCKSSLKEAGFLFWVFLGVFIIPLSMQAHTAAIFVKIAQRDKRFWELFLHFSIVVDWFVLQTIFFWNIIFYLFWKIQTMN